MLRQCARLLAPGGRIFVDVNHRYNAVHYGWLPTAWRLVRGGSHDVVVTWRSEGVSTAGHVFTGREFSDLCREQQGTGPLCRLRRRIMSVTEGLYDTHQLVQMSGALARPESSGAGRSECLRHAGGDVTAAALLRRECTKLRSPDLAP